MAKIFGKNNIKKFQKSLLQGLDKVKDNIVVGLEKAEYMINLDSQSMIPYDSGEAYESWFSRIEVEKNQIKLVVGYDEQGRLADYLPLIHEYIPVEEGYGSKAWEDRGVKYTDEGFKLTGIGGASIGKPSPMHQPQILFLRKAMEQNWQEVSTQIIKVSFD